MKVVKQPIRTVVKDPLYEVQCPIDYNKVLGERGCGIYYMSLLWKDYLEFAF